MRDGVTFSLRSRTRQNRSWRPFDVPHQPPKDDFNPYTRSQAFTGDVHLFMDFDEDD